jgi:hypothetical protein
MKKVLALFSSLLVFAGAKAQTTPAVKKETTKPVVTKPIVTADPLKAAATNATIKQTDKAIKFDNIKKANTVQFKENNAVNKPHKG